MRRLHAQVITEHGAAKAKARAQLALDPVLREAGGHRIDLLVNDVRQHHPGNRAGAYQALVRAHIVENVAVLSSIDRQLQVRIGNDGPMAWKMLGDGGHAGTAQAAREGVGEICDSLGFAVKRAVTNDLADPPVEVDTRSETQIDADSSQLRGNQPAGFSGRLQAGIGVTVVFIADTAHRRHGRKAVAKTLYTATLVIDRDQQRRAAQRTNIGDQVSNLLDGFVVP